MAAALGRLERHEPVVASLLRRCVATRPDRRPSPRLLCRTFRGIQTAEAKGKSGVGKRRGSVGGGKRRARIRRPSRTESVLAISER